MNNDLQIAVPVMKDQRELVGKMTKAVSDSSVKAVSFRLFGGLLLLPTSEDHDIFLIMEQEFSDICTAKKTFSELRIEAEVEANKKFREYCSVTLEQIYTILAKKAKISDGLKHTLMDRECEITAKLCFTRNFGKSLLDTAKKNGKRIIALADTVLPREAVERMAEGFGCDEIIVTNEVSCTETRDESIFGAILEKADVPVNFLMNIGDSVTADIELPIMKGAKALLLSQTKDNLLRSGRLRSFIQARQIFDYDTVGFLGLHLFLGLYSAYFFDIPRVKSVHSDFCGNAYIMGAVVYGPAKMAGTAGLDENCIKIYEAMEKNEDMRRGGDDLCELFRRHFGDISGKLTYNGFTLPLELLAAHGDAMDVGLLKNTMSAADHKAWKESITDAPTAAVKRKTEQTGLEKLADRMFPPGTRVRNLAEGALFKLKSKH